MAVASLTDIARAAGVSLATASRAFSAPDRLAAATLGRVLDAAADLGYEPAAGIVSRNIGVVVPDVSNAVFAALIKSIQNQAWHGRHRMVLVDTNEESSREREQLASVAKTVDGIILCSPRLASDEIPPLIGSVPLVAINGEVAGAPSILMEAAEGIRQAVENLYALGHRHVTYVPGPAGSWANGRRAAAVAEFCNAWDIELSVVGNQSATVHGGLASAASVVATGATAVIAYNDLVALGVQSGARALGRRCPESLSIVGIDDLDVAAAAEPGLTSVRVAIERSGALALELLLERISGRPAPTAAVHLDSQLIVRGSTARARSAELQHN